MLRSSHVLQVAPDDSACQLLPDELRSHFVVSALRNVLAVKVAMRKKFDDAQAAATKKPLESIARHPKVLALVRSPRLILRAARNSPALVVEVQAVEPVTKSVVPDREGNAAGAVAPALAAGSTEAVETPALAAGSTEAVEPVKAAEPDHGVDADVSPFEGLTIRVASRREHIRRQIEQWMSPDHYYRDPFWREVAQTSNSA